MLVLSRKPSQQVLLQNRTSGELIQVLIVRTRSGQCSLGFNAPQNWSIQRDNSTHRIQETADSIEELGRR